MDGQKVFETLRRTSVYRPTSPEKAKRQVFLSFWNEASDALRERFGPAGINGEGLGFGYLVEELAKRSPKLPQNTPRAEHLAGLILGALRTGDNSLVGVERRLSNPDTLWIKFTGRRAEVTGIGEIKSSAAAYQKNPEQILFQEDSIRHALGSIAIDKTRGSAHEYFRLRKIVVREPMKKLLIVPRGSKNGFGDLPEGWEIQEIEFSRGELIFIAKTLWPDFQPKTKFESGLLAKYETGFLKSFFQWGIARLRHIFPNEEGVSNIKLRNILLFNLVTKKIPLSEKDVDWVVTALQKWTGFLWLCPQSLLRNHKFWDKKFLEKFLILFGGEDKESVKLQIVFFLTNLGLIEKCVNAWKSSKPQVQSRIDKMQNFDLLDL